MEDQICFGDDDVAGGLLIKLQHRCGWTVYLESAVETWGCLQRTEVVCKGSYRSKLKCLPIKVDRPWCFAFIFGRTVSVVDSLLDAILDFVKKGTVDVFGGGKIICNKEYLELQPCWIALMMQFTCDRIVMTWWKELRFGMTAFLCAGGWVGLLWHDASKGGRPPTTYMSKLDTIRVRNLPIRTARSCVPHFTKERFELQLSQYVLTNLYNILNWFADTFPWFLLVKYCFFLSSISSMILFAPFFSPTFFTHIDIKRWHVWEWMNIVVVDFAVFGRPCRWLHSRALLLTDLWYLWCFCNFQPRSHVPYFIHPTLFIC